MNFNEIGELRKVREVEGHNPDGSEKERFRDERINHVAAALGFVRGRAANAFQKHDRAERDGQYLAILTDDPDLDDNKLKREVRDLLYRVIEKDEGISTEAVRNRLSKARGARSRAK